VQARHLIPMKIDAIYLRELRLPLVKPFVTSFGATTERRVLLVEIKGEGFTGWGECVAGEHPYYSYETIDTAWLMLSSELAPRLLAADLPHSGKCSNAFKQVRGHRMAKAALENAVWDLEAQLLGVPLWQLLGGTREVINCGVSIGIQPSIEATLEEIEKCKPGWDIELFAAVRNRWPGILLSCDANSAYRMKDMDAIVTWDQFDMLMIEQPLWSDDFYFHSMLQRRMETPICLDESIHNRRDALAAIDMESCQIINIKVGRVGGFSEAIGVHNAAQERGIRVWCGGMLETGIGRSHNIALSSLPNFSLPGDVSASKRYWKEDIIEPEVEVSKAGQITVPDTPGRGFEVRADLIERLTVRKEEVRAMELVS
jgi:O-succinylbenzoate synthase